MTQGHKNIDLLFQYSPAPSKHRVLVWKPTIFPSFSTKIRVYIKLLILQLAMYCYTKKIAKETFCLYI
jgi:hypothetical protein